ncbi:MAG: universal stress protein, partial [Pseudomonadota bacterium]
MIKKIMVPVDLAHKDDLKNAISQAGQISKLNSATIHLVGVTSSAPTEVAKTPEAYDEKLKAFAKEVTEQTGCPVETLSLVDVDVSADLGHVILDKSDELKVDLIVMASHVPGFVELGMAANAGSVARPAKGSV